MSQIRPHDVHMSDSQQFLDPSRTLVTTVYLALVELNLCSSLFESVNTNSLDVLESEP